MPSPFPGVDPYIDAQGLWRDFHASFITYLRDAINDRLPGHYDARIDERVQLLGGGSGEVTHEFLPDVAVIRGRAGAAGPAAAVLPGSGPMTIPLVYMDEARETYLKVFRNPGRTLVAVVELLSPSNKAETGTSLYVLKRDALIRQPVHLVELDFLTRGRRPRLARPLPPGDYFAFVARGDRKPDCEVYPWSVRQPLPTVPLPLLAPDPDVPLDLAAVFATAYERGQYACEVDYGADLPLPIAAEDRAWAEGVARAARAGNG